MSDRPVDVLSEPLVTATVTTHDPSKYTLHNSEDGTVWQMGDDGRWKRATPDNAGRSPIDDLRALSEAATPGPWIVTPDTGSYGAEIATIEDGIGVVRPDDDSPIEPGDPEADAALIVAAVNYVRARLSEPTGSEEGR